MKAKAETENLGNHGAWIWLGQCCVRYVGWISSGKAEKSVGYFIWIALSIRLNTGFKIDTHHIVSNAQLQSNSLLFNTNGIQCEWAGKIPKTESTATGAERAQQLGRFEAASIGWNWLRFVWMVSEHWDDGRRIASIRTSTCLMDSLNNWNLHKSYSAAALCALLCVVKNVHEFWRKILQRCYRLFLTIVHASQCIDSYLAFIFAPMFLPILADFQSKNTARHTNRRSHI